MEIRFLNGGYCSQVLAFVDGRSLRVARFHAVFLAVLHPSRGWIVVDTGYGGRFARAASRWPYLLYRYATPAVMNGTAAEALARAGIDANEVGHVVITHFHADHIGGLADFPTARVHFHGDALGEMVRLKPLAQTRAAFLPDLMPAGLAERAAPVRAASFAVQGNFPLPTHDLFGDGLIRLVDLPGHAPGHVGVLLGGGPEPLLYASDAYWMHDQVDGRLDVTRVALSMQWNPADYRRTIGQLRSLHRAGTCRMLACHDHLTQQFIVPVPVTTRGASGEFYSRASGLLVADLRVKLALGAAVGVLASVMYQALQRAAVFPSEIRMDCPSWHFVPFQAWWLGPYFSMFIIVGAAWVFLPSAQEAWRFGRYLVAVAAVGWVTFLFYPTECARPDLADASWAYQALLAVDGPKNCMPCLHASLSILSGAALVAPGRVFSSGRSRAIVAVWVLFITFSAVALHQHTGMDTLVGTALGFAASALYVRRMARQTSGSVAGEGIAFRGEAIRL
jgi:glyoxylase-like metal-dependent hydrolase (beta-lactamase superfamily II)